MPSPRIPANPECETPGQKHLLWQTQRCLFLPLSVCLFPTLSPFSVPLCLSLPVLCFSAVVRIAGAAINGNVRLQVHPGSEKPPSLASGSPWPPRLASLPPPLPEPSLHWRKRLNWRSVPGHVKLNCGLWSVRGEVGSQPKTALGSSRDETGCRSQRASPIHGFLKTDLPSLELGVSVC